MRARTHPAPLSYMPPAARLPRRIHPTHLALLRRRAVAGVGAGLSLARVRHCFRDSSALRPRGGDWNWRRLASVVDFAEIIGLMPCWCELKRAALVWLEKHGDVSKVFAGGWICVLYFFCPLQRITCKLADALDTQPWRMPAALERYLGGSSDMGETYQINFERWILGRRVRIMGLARSALARGGAPTQHPTA